MIAGAEGVQADDGVSVYELEELSLFPQVELTLALQVLTLILQLANGDLRKAITFLQTAQRLHSATDPPTPISSISSESFRLFRFDAQERLESKLVFQSTRSLVSFRARL